MAAIVVKGYRPSKHSPIPPPLYLTSPQTTYCTTCGRLISPHRKSTLTCSAKCKTHKPNALDTSISAVLHHLLTPSLSIPDIISLLPADLTHDEEVKDTRRPGPKGDKRLIIPCALVESIVFGRAADVNRAQGRRRTRAGRMEDAAAAAEEEEHKGEYDEEVLRAALARLNPGSRAAVAPQPEEEEDSEDDDGEGEGEGPAENGDEKRREGMLRASQRERVRNACRRAVVFGLSPPGAEPVAATSVRAQPTVEEEERTTKGGGKGKKRTGSTNSKTSVPQVRRCEAIMRGAVVEPSYAKGDWGVRWAEEGFMM